MTPSKPRDMKRLRQAIKWSWEQLKPFRQARLHRIRQYAGHNYSGAGEGGQKTPVNLLELAASIYIQHLAANTPRVLFTTVHAGLKPDAADLTQATNMLMAKIDLAVTLRRAILEAIFAWGKVKIGLTPAGAVDIGGTTHQATQPFADVISLDNWVHDANALVRERVQFCGDFYQVPLDDLKEIAAEPSSGYDKAAIDKLTPDSAETYSGADETAAEISRQRARDENEYRPQVSMGDIWIPSERVILTIARFREDIAPLRVVEWDGPEQGPYRDLIYQDVPDNVHPLAPSALWVELHDLANRLWRKLGRQAERQKNVAVYKPAAKADAERIQQANDGDMVAVDAGVDGVGEKAYGGPNPATQAFALQVKQLFAYLAGNIDVLGGLAPQSQTVGQDQLLAANAGTRAEIMRGRTEKFAGEVIHDLAWHLYHDPLIELPLTKRVEGTDIELPATWTPERRASVDFLDYNFQLVPYSMQPVSPGQRLQIIQAIITNYIAPFIPAMQQQGISLNFEALLKKVGRYGNVSEDLDDVLVFTGQPMDAGQSIVGESPRPPKPAATRREYVRINRPGATPGNADAAMAQLLMGGQMQPAEAEAAFRQQG